MILEMVVLLQREAFFWILCYFSNTKSRSPDDIVGVLERPGHNKNVKKLDRFN